MISLIEQQLQKHNKCKNKLSLTLPVNDQGKTRDFHIYKLQSVYHSATLNKHFHLHPELVHTIQNANTNAPEEATVLCPAWHGWLLAAICNKGGQDTLDSETPIPDNSNPISKGALPQNATPTETNDSNQQSQPGRKKKKKNPFVPPEYSIAGGIDFGNPNRLGLEPTSIAKNKILVKYRHFHNVVKVQSYHEVGKCSDYTKCQLRGHNILFCHDAPVVAHLSLMIRQVTNGDISDQI